MKWSNEQQSVLDDWNEPMVSPGYQMTVVQGGAGVGKTQLLCEAALSAAAPYKSKTACAVIVFPSHTAKSAGFKHMETYAKNKGIVLSFQRPKSLDSDENDEHTSDRFMYIKRGNDVSVLEVRTVAAFLGKAQDRQAKVDKHTDSKFRTMGYLADKNLEHYSQFAHMRVLIDEMSMVSEEDFRGFKVKQAIRENAPMISDYDMDGFLECFSRWGVQVSVYMTGDLKQLNPPQGTSLENWLINAHKTGRANFRFHELTKNFRSGNNLKLTEMQLATFANGGMVPHEYIFDAPDNVYFYSDKKAWTEKFLTVSELEPAATLALSYHRKAAAHVADQVESRLSVDPELHAWKGEIARFDAPITEDIGGQKRALTHQGFTAEILDYRHNCSELCLPWLGTLLMSEVDIEVPLTGQDTILRTVKVIKQSFIDTPRPTHVTGRAIKKLHDMCLKLSPLFHVTRDPKTKTNTGSWLLKKYIQDTNGRGFKAIEQFKYFLTAELELSPTETSFLFGMHPVFCTGQMVDLNNLPDDADLYLGGPMKSYVTDIAGINSRGYPVSRKNRFLVPTEEGLTEHFNLIKRLIWGRGFYPVRDLFMPIRYSGTSTTHGAQGLQFKHVFIDERDIASAENIGDIPSCGYVASSRTTHSNHYLLVNK